VGGFKEAPPMSLTSNVKKGASWQARELYEFLSLVVVGACLWMIGDRLGFFAWASQFALEHNLLDFVMLSLCMGMGVFVASVRKSILLRKAMLARIEAESYAASMARHDALTGLANRRLFHETVERALASRGRNDHFAVMLIDLDRFKPVNDVHGHAAGNAVLCAIAERLRHLLPPKGVVARLGGDEFAAFVPYDASRDSLARLADQMIVAIRRPIPWNQGQVDVGATIGIALAAEGSAEPDALLHAADVAMYQAKREGRGAFCFFQAEMSLALKARARLEADLRNAITNGEIVPFYQPIVSLPGKELIGFEVLARWRHPRDGLITPDKFIPVAEETGMIADLFYGLLRQACDDAGAWPSHLQLAVNISPQQVQDRWLPERILQILAETGFPPNRLEVEVTETALINDLEAARAALTSLQNVGVRIALDDFGTGYSSLYHLRELRFNKIKIDRSYISSLKEGSERTKLVDAIIQLGSSLSLETTAEGIETPSSLDWLSDQGCNFGQGYLFGQAMPKNAADKFLKTPSTVLAQPTGGGGKEAA
jgi:diguanylate cyclase (GGDEF)-like protein